MSQKVIVIGGVASGASAAAKLRRLDPYDSIVILEKGDYISYANCGLPYFISGLVRGENQLIARTPREMQAEGIEVRLKSEALSIDRAQNTVLVKNLATGRPIASPMTSSSSRPAPLPSGLRSPGSMRPASFPSGRSPPRSGLKRTSSSTR